MNLDPKKCKFNTVKRILLPLNTTWDKIVVSNDSHWMITELDLTTDVFIIYDWTMGREQRSYDKIAGVLPSLSSVDCASVRK